MTEPKRIKVTRVLEIEGPEEWVRATLSCCVVEPGVPFYPSILDASIVETSRREGYFRCACRLRGCSECA